MNKAEFLSALQKRLGGLPQEELERTLNYYDEMIDDHVEEGMTEAEAVESLGSMEEIVAQILGETSLFKLLHEKVKPKRTLRAWEIVLIVLGFPLWFPLLVAVAAVFFSLYAVIWSLVISLYAVNVALAAAGVCGVVGGVAYLFGGLSVTGVLAIGGGLASAGLFILLIFGCRLATTGAVRLGKCLLLGTKALLVRKEGTQ